MPLIQNTDYDNSKLLFNGHLQTIVPALFRKPIPLPFERERINTEDMDFLDLDWLRNGSGKLVIVSHGLEGNSKRPYMLGMAREFFTKNYDVVNWNFRGCSEEMNKQPIFYHSGATYDLKTIIEHCGKNYEEIFLIGFSLGGNLTLKYLGESKIIQPKIKKAVTISVPLHLESSCDKISRGGNTIYAKRFLRTLKEKVVLKSKKYPGHFNLKLLDKAKTLKTFDDYFTGPLHGFESAHEYYEKCSSLYFLKNIHLPNLIINAQNDPFLSKACFPVELAMDLEKTYMEFPKQGGHVGFSPKNRKEIYWSEKRAFEFISSNN